ncbi:helix-turn-helix domain-containing protein [Chelonobacter oris]|uniref:helix-turn-helix domain-containing protein n=1 Tax=Chelonobacter oris TaxID=505317 RepID=UPI0024497A5C|nr:helix-turn-helix transcriptional regulator [Chelonobacter oris]
MKEQLARFMEQKGLTQTQVAKALGKSVAVINQYLKGTYKGVNKDIDEAVDRLRVA